MTILMMLMIILMMMITILIVVISKSQIQGMISHLQVIPRDDYDEDCCSRIVKRIVMMMLRI